MQYDRIINRRVADVPPSGIRKFFDIVRQMPDAISLGVGKTDRRSTPPTGALRA